MYKLKAHFIFWVVSMFTVATFLPAIGFAHSDDSSSSSASVKIEQLTVGERAVYALDQDGRLWAWGLYQNFLLGGVDTPKRVDFFDDKPAIESFQATYDSLTVLLEDGTAWKLVRNASNDKMFEQLESSELLFDRYILHEDGTVSYKDSSSGRLIPVQGLKNIKKIVLGNRGQVGLALTHEGKLWIWGNRTVGNIKLPYLYEAGRSFFEAVQVPELDQIEDVAAGLQHFVVLKKDGTVWAWGSNEHHQLGTTAVSSSVQPVQVKGLNDVVAVVSGSAADVTFALRSDGAVYAWGSNVNRETGTGHREEKTISTPQEVKFTPPRERIGDLISVEYLGSNGNEILTAASDTNGNVIAVTGRELLVSHDHGSNWTSQPLPESNRYYTVRKVHDAFFLWTLHASKLYYSKDGKEWIDVTIELDNKEEIETSSIRYLNSQYVLLGFSRDNFTDQERTHVFTSTDGIEWVRQGAIADNVTDILWNGKTYTAIAGGYQYFGDTQSRNQFVIIPSEPRSAELIVYTSENLNEWTMRSGSRKDLRYTLTINGEPRKNYNITWMETDANGVHRFIDGYGNELWTNDGIRFQLKRAPKAFEGATITDPPIRYGDETFIYAALWREEGVVLTTKDHVNWTRRTISNISDYMKVEHTGKRFVGFTRNGTIALSGDGITWYIQKKGYPTDYFNDVIKTGSRYVAVGSKFGYSVPSIYVSADGETWNEVLRMNRLDTSSQWIQSIAWNGSRYVAVGSNTVWVSTDGATWKKTNMPHGTSLQKVVWTGKQFVVMDRLNGTKLMSSTDGLKWTTVLTTDANLYDLVAHDGNLVAVGTKNGRAIAIQSTDLEQWHAKQFTLGDQVRNWDRMQRASIQGDISQTFTNVQWVRDQFIIMADAIYTSKDGKKWTIIEGDYTEFIQEYPQLYSGGRLLWTGQEYVYEKDSTLAFSKDLQHWKFYEQNAFSHVKKMIWTGSYLLGVGDNGLMVRIKK